MELTADQRDYLTKYISTGVRNVRSLRRARILLSSDQRLQQKDIALQLGCHAATVSDTIKRYHECGRDVEQALIEKPRSGQPTRITPEIEAQITAMACEKGPDGQARWTLRLMSKRLVELELIDSIAPETVRQVLKKASLSPGRKSSGASGK